MSHVSTAAPMTTRHTSCAPVQRITVASLGSCQTHLVVEEAMKPRDAGCTTVTPLRRPQHAHTCVGRNAPHVSACSTQSRYPRPWTAQWNEKLGHHHPMGHHHRAITLPGSSLCLLQATRRWGAPGRYSGGEASTLPASPLLPHPGIARPFAFYLWPRLWPAIVVTEGDTTAASRQPLPMMLQVSKPLHFRHSTLRADSRIRH